MVLEKINNRGFRILLIITIVSTVFTNGALENQTQHTTTKIDGKKGISIIPLKNDLDKNITKFIEKDDFLNANKSIAVESNNNNNNGTKNFDGTTHLNIANITKVIIQSTTSKTTPLITTEKSTSEISSTVSTTKSTITTPTIITKTTATTYVNISKPIIIVSTEPSYVIETEIPATPKNASIAAIIVGCIIGILILAVIVIFVIIFMKRRRSGKQLFVHDDKMTDFFDGRTPDIIGDGDGLDRDQNERRSYRAKKGEVEIVETTKMDPIQVRRNETMNRNSDLNSLRRKKKQAPLPPPPSANIANARKSTRPRSALTSIASIDDDIELTTFGKNANNGESLKPLLTTTNEYSEIDEYDRTKNPFVSNNNYKY